MKIEYTAEERQGFAQITARCNERLRALGAWESREENPQKHNRRMEIYMQLQEEKDAFAEKCQQAHFSKIKDNPQKILENARQQVGLCLNELYSDVLRYTLPEDLRKIDFLTWKDGAALLKANYAIQYMREELKLHINALREDAENLQALYSIIIEEVENNGHTDSAEIIITDNIKTQDIMRYRRSPLSDIATYGLMNDKASAQLIQEGELFQQQPNGQLMLRWSINQAPKEQKQVPVYIALTYEGTEGKITKKLTAFDKAVYDAIGTRFYYWKQDNEQRPLYITPQEVWRTMNGKRSGDGQAKPSSAQVKRICDSIDKMRFTRFFMDISEEVKAFDLYIEDERITGGHIDSYLINSSKVEFTTDKGNIVSGYRIAEEPILYTYNAVKKHILYVPYEMLDTSTRTSDAENVTEFRNYLLQQIQLMKNAAEGKNGKYFRRNNVILIETIYRETGIQPPEERLEGRAFTSEASKQTVIRRLRKSDREKIEGILDAWKSKQWIKDYAALNSKNQPIKEKQQAKGYRISI